MSNRIDVIFSLQHPSYKGPHVQQVMKDLGISYTLAVPQTITDQWWFFGCKNLPEQLPDFIKIHDFKDITRLEGRGLSKENIQYLNKEFPDIGYEEAHFKAIDCTWTNTPGGTPTGFVTGERYHLYSFELDGWMRQFNTKFKGGFATYDEALKRAEELGLRINHIGYEFEIYKTTYAERKKVG